MRHAVTVAALLVVACGTKSERNEQAQPSVKPLPAEPVVADGSIPSAADASLTPCIVRAELTTSGVTLTGGGISGRDVTALRAVAKKCSAQLVAADDVTFETVTKTVGLIIEQGIDEVRLGEPFGQWMSVELGRVTKLWNAEPTATLIATVKAVASRLGPDNASIVEQVVSAMAHARQNEPIGKQTTDRGLFEAIAQVVGLRRASAPVAFDLLERVVLPALEIDTTAAVASPSSGLSKVETGVELFQSFVTQASKRPAQTGLLGAIPAADLSRPYVDNNPIEVRDGDWIVVAAEPLAERLKKYDESKLVAHYDRFIKGLKRRDDDRVLVDTTTRALKELRDCVTTAVLNRDALVFRALPQPTVRLSGPDDETVPTVVITKTAITVKGESAKGSLLSALPQTSPRTIAIEADPALPFGTIGVVAAAIGTPGHVTFVLRHR